MSNTPIQDLPAQEPSAQELSSSSGQTLPSRPFQPISDPSASKKVCFYKSGDYKFSGHRMVINARTFKTFDALLDALSKKVPLPFGVRTITTPRGTHLVKALDDLHDGGSYVCSDQKRVKPLNLEEVNRRQVPWNTTRPFSAGRRRQFGRRNEVTNRPAKVTERVAVRTPKKLLVIKNRDPTVKRTIVLQRRTAPTFDALLDYLSQILQFPVLKLFSTDGRRVDGLAALILCSGVVVAAGNEPFRLGNYSFHRTGQMAQAVYMDTVEPSMLQPRAQNNKSLSSGRGSRNFSLSSERYIVDRINKSRNGSMNSQLHHHNKSFETEANHRHTSAETYGTGRVANECHACIVPQDDDIEKSFRVNQDGSMTVEMKVHLTIKEEEMLHWTTTLSRSSLSKRTLCASISESDNSSPDTNNAIAKDSSSISEDETKEENCSAGAGKGVGFSDGQVYQGYASTTLGKSKAGFRRTPTPGPRRVNKGASVESVKTVTETGVQESTLGHYSYMERTADGETTEGYCVVRHSSSSSHRPIPKPRKTASAGATKKGSHSSIRSTGVAEVLQIQNNGMEVTETVMHIYESQGCYDNYDSVPLHGSTRAPDSKPSTVSSSNDCDIDFSTTDSLQRQKEEMLSLSSEPISPTHDITNNLSPVTENETRIATNSQGKGTVIKDKTREGEKRKNPARSQKSSTSTSGSDKKQKGSTINPSKQRSSSDKLSSNASMGKKSLSSSESVKSGQKPQIKRLSKDEKTPRKEQGLLANTENLKRSPSQRQNLSKAPARDNGHNVNTPTGRPPMKKNMVGILPPKKTILPGKKTISKPKSVIENRISSPKKAPDLSESLSMPSLNPSPSEIHQYVENWLEKVSPDPVPYTEESEPQTKVVFKIGGDSESDEKTDEHSPSPGDAIKKSPSCLSVPLCHAEPASALLQNEQYARGLCVSMPSVRVDPMHQENRLRAHKSAEAIAPADDESSSSNILSPKEKIKPALRQLCSSIQCIRRPSDTTASNLEKSNSLPDFPTQVASVFGSSCKAFLSFLSVMTLRDSLAGSVLEDQSRSTSEAMFMMESLQKISAIEDEEELRASLTDLQSRASSQLRERWKDFQILRERLESEPLSPRVSETEFALDVLSEGGDVFEDQHMIIDELMEELNMPQDLREQISSTIHQARSFYPVEESTFVETERAQSDSEEDVEKFVEECNECIAEDITHTEQGDDDKEQAKMIDQLEQEEKVQETSNDVKEFQISQTERDESLEDEENEEEEQVEEVEERMTDREDGDRKAIEEDDGEVTETEEREREEEAEEELVTEEKNQEEWEADKGSKEEEEGGTVEKVEEGTADEMTVDGEEEGEQLEEVGEKEVVEETDVGLMDEEDQEARVDDSVEETDEREGVEDTEEEEEKGEDEIDEEVDEEENGAKKGEEADEKAEVVIEETDEGEEEDNVIDEVLQEEEEDEEAAVEEEAEEGIEENEEEEMTEVIEEKEVENIIGEDGEKEEEEEEADEFTVYAEEEDVEENKEEEVTEVIEGKDEAENIIEEQEEEEEQADDLTVDIEEDDIDESEEEEVTEVIEGKDEVENIIEEQEEEEEQAGDFTVDIEEDDIDESEEEEVTEVTEGKDEVENIIEEQDEEEEQADDLTVDIEEDDIDENEEEEVTEVIEGKDEAENMTEEQEEEEEQADDLTVDVEEDDIDENEEEEVTKVTGGKDEVENMIEEQKEEEEEAEEFTVEAEEEGEEGIKENEEEDMTEVVEEKDEVENITEEVEEEEEETVVVTEIVVEDEVIEEEEEEEMEEVIEEEGKTEQEEELEDARVENIEDRVITDEEEQEIEQEEKCDEGEESEGELEKTKNSLEEFVEEEVVIEEMEIEENLKAGQTLDEEEEREDDEEYDGSEEVEEQESKDEEEEENVSDDADSIAGKNLLEEALYLQQESSCEEEANVNTKSSEHDTESPTKYSSEGQCEDEKGNGTDTANETDEERSSSLPHPVEISQELLDFVNYALQSSSLIFTYDAQGNLRIEPDNARVIQTKQTFIPKRKEDSSYGLKRLPSPSTSELSDYRPETSESGGYKSQDSVDIVTESGDETSLKPSPFRRRKIPNGRVNSELSVASNSEAPQKLKSRGNVSSSESGTKASREDLSYFSAASSQKADAEATQRISFDSADGVLIDQGRWLLKENHLIRKSPPVSLGMYGNADSTSIENTSEDSPPHYKTQHSPLAALSSSELEEMAKPQTPKCTYYNMPHGSDSDPFLDDSSYKSGKKDSSSVKGRGFRVSPTIDTTKTWASKNGSMSSFASVEFKMTDRKVHPEGESSAVTQARRTSSGGGGVLQAQDSLETLHVRCGQYCPIL